MINGQKIAFISTILNEEKGLINLLDSLLKQSLLPDEIVIVDGGSNDNTLSILRSYESENNNIVIIEAPNTNIAEGRNIAIEHTKADIIAVTDAGCIPNQNWLSELVDPIINDLSVSAVSGKIVPESESRFEYFSGLLSLPDHTTSEQSTLFYGRCSAFKFKLWETVGGYPEWLYTAEDSLFALSAKEHGFKIAHSPNAIIHWRPRPTLKKLAKMFFLYGQGNGRINWGSLRGSLYWMRYHFLLLLSMVTGVYYPSAWLLTLSVVVFLYINMISPTLVRIRKQTNDLSREFYIPLLVFTRNISSNIGYIWGHIEYRRNPLYKSKLAHYLKPHKI